MPARLVRVLVCAVLALVGLGAAAQSLQRIPSNAAGGKLTVVLWPLVKIDGKERRASPGARIYNFNNFTVTANMVAPESPVRYVLDGMGQIRTIWLVKSLSEPTAAPEPAPAPAEPAPRPPGDPVDTPREPAAPPQQ